MYRKHLKMARGEGEPAIKSHFVERVVKLPMVHVAWDYATNTYSHIKESNKLVNFTLTNAEKSVTFVAGQAKPVVLKFEKQIQAVDNLACKGLGTLEEKVPFITKPAEEIIDDTRKLYSNTVYSRLDAIRNYGRDKVKSITDYGLQKANFILDNRVAKSVLSSVDGALAVTESYIDYILPPTEKEKTDAKKKETQKKTGLNRLASISNKVRHRAYRSLTSRIESIQETAVDIFLIYPLGVVEVAKGHVENAVKYLSEILTSFTQRESDGTEAAEKPNALIVVRDSALWLIGMIRVIPSVLPMYIYGFVSWLDGKRNENNEALEENVKENGTVNNHTSKRGCANSRANRKAANARSNVGADHSES